MLPVESLRVGRSPVFFQLSPARLDGPSRFGTALFRVILLNRLVPNELRRFARQTAPGCCGFPLRSAHAHSEGTQSIPFESATFSFIPGAGLTNVDSDLPFDAQPGCFNALLDSRHRHRVLFRERLYRGTPTKIRVQAKRGNMSRITIRIVRLEHIRQGCGIRLDLSSRIGFLYRRREQFRFSAINKGSSACKSQANGATKEQFRGRGRHSKWDSNALCCNLCRSPTQF